MSLVSVRAPACWAATDGTCVTIFACFFLILSSSSQSTWRCTASSGRWCAHRTVGIISNRVWLEVDFEGRIPRVDWSCRSFLRLHIHALAKEGNCGRHCDCCSPASLGDESSARHVLRGAVVFFACLSTREWPDWKTR
jgi:hypothetical protein